jgi:DNA adenine methylase
MLQEIIKKDKSEPFLRWAGGKGWLIKFINDYIPETFNNYHEPFLGGGAIFFHLAPSKKYYLSDLNEELINTYIQIRDNVDEVIIELKKHVNSETHYYQVRRTDPKSDLGRAVRFIYLNKTSFNGIYRVNSNGGYNVPYGFRKSADIVNGSCLLSVSLQLKKATLKTQDFGESLSKVKKGDLVFLDPPYTVAHENNGFISYNQKIFSLNDQKRLARWVEKINELGAYYILTNAKHKGIKEIYSQINEPMTVYRSSTIGGKGAQRGKINEYLFTNISKPV